jgi:hypothetical protein
MAEINDPGLASEMASARRVQTAVPQYSIRDRRSTCAPWIPDFPSEEEIRESRGCLIIASESPAKRLVAITKVDGA